MDSTKDPGQHVIGGALPPVEDRQDTDGLSLDVDIESIDRPSQ